VTEWLKGNALEKRQANGDLGGTMRLGAYPAVLDRGSKVSEIYGTTEISERHRHRYEVNTAYKGRLEQHGMRFCGMSPDGVLPEIIEYADHPWFIGVQYHPELKSRPFAPHPLFASLVEAAVERSRLVQRRVLMKRDIRSSPKSGHFVRRSACPAWAQKVTSEEDRRAEPALTGYRRSGSPGYATALPQDFGGGKSSAIG
jgi:hypothetical protein